MTKINKLGKSTFVIAILSFLLVAVLAFGGTYAYFSDNAAVKGTATMGTLTMKLKDGTNDAADFTISGYVQPNQDIMSGKSLTIDATGTTIEYFVRVKVDATVATAGEHASQCGEPEDILLESLGEDWTYDETTKYYYLEDSETAANAKKCAAAEATNVTPVVKIDPKVGNKGCTAYMGKTITVNITVEVLQANYLGTNATGAVTITALAAGWAGWQTIA